MQIKRELIHGGDILTCKERCLDADILDFSANINPLGMPESVRNALESSADACLHYPDQLCRVLKRALGKFEQIPHTQILCGNGASDIIFRIAYALRPKKAMLLAPTFAEYEQALRQVDCEILLHTLDPLQDFAVDKFILSALDGVDILFICNPNNPCGALADSDLLLELLERCKKNNTILVIDECFLDFVEDGETYSLKSKLSCYDNLIILRAFTKIFAMPGIRLGYALCSNFNLLNKIDQAGAPWSVSVPAQLCGIAAAEEIEFVARSVALVKQERNYLTIELAKLGLRVFPAVANYILFYTIDTTIAEKLLENGIAIRDCSNYKNLSAGYYRIAVRNRKENDALLGAIKEKLCKQ